MWALDPEIPDLVKLLGRHFGVLVEDPAAFIDETRVLPLESKEGVRIDVIFGLLSFEQDAIARTETVTVVGGARGLNYLNR